MCAAVISKHITIFAGANGYLCSTDLCDNSKSSTVNLSQSVSNLGKYCAIATLDASHIALTGVGSLTKDSNKGKRYSLGLNYR